ncbi:MAG TPA: condensation domain-containing protein, partial [Thermoanaerobaculia bacterium]|nr:condensation domain-containing protein [Thermoanaerobaculia bacterium]
FDLTLVLERREEGRLGASLEYSADLFDAATAERLLAAFARLFRAALENPGLRVSELPLLSAEEGGQLLARSRYRYPQAEAARAAETAGGWEPPRGPLEARIAALFSETLETEGIGRHDDFFELGGHSLLASRVVFRLREELGWEVPLQCLFGSPTVAELASHLVDLRGTVEEEAAVVRVERGGAMPVSYAQERLWFLEQLMGPSALYHIAAGFEVRGNLSVAALETAIAGVVARHEGLRTRFRPEQGRPLAWIGPAETRLLAVDLTALPPARRAAEAVRAAGELARRPFDLTRDLLLRAWAVRQGDDFWSLGWVVHHLVCDGGSLAILEREIGEMYAAALEGRGARLPDLAFQPVDLAAAERREGAERWSSQVRFWRGELAGLEPLALPADRARPAWSSRHRGRTRPLAWRPGVADAVASLARAAGTTPMAVALAGFSAVLARWSGREDFGVGVPVEGRWRREAEPLVGLFVNTLVVRADVSGDPAGTELLARLAGRLAGALAHGEVPFERLVEELAPERDLDRGPWFQVLVSSRPVSGRRLALPGAEPAPAWIDTATSKFDLSLFVDAEAEPGWGGAIEYDADLLEDATVERLVGWLERAWVSWAGRPDLRLSELPLWTVTEEAEILARRPRGLSERPPAAPAIVHEEPRGALETRIAALFGEALGCEGVGRHDDFFALGGHSLLASRVVFRLREELGWEVPLQCLFGSPTVAELAGHLADLRGAVEEERAVVRVERAGALPVSYAQERLWFLEQLAGPSALHHVAAGFEVRGALSLAALDAALADVVARHESLRTRFRPERGRPVAWIGPARAAEARPSAVDLAALPPALRAAEAERVAGELARRPFDLTRDLLLRALAIRQARDFWTLGWV